MAQQVALRAYRRMARRFLLSWKGLVGLSLIVLFILLPYLGPYLSPYHPLEIGVGPPNQPPTREHPLGTTNLGQDVFSQFLAGGQVSVLVGTLTGLFASLLAALVGITSGYYRGLPGSLLSLLTDTFLVIPILPLIIILAAYLGPSLTNQILILTLLSWPFPARVIRAQVLSLRERAFVESSVLTGSGKLRIMFSDILPNVVPLILSNGVLVVVFAILFQAAINFLGLGDPTLASWGAMLYYAQLSGAIASGQWWWVLPPGLGISLLAFAFSLIALQLDVVLAEWAHVGGRA